MKDIIYSLIENEKHYPDQIAVKHNEDVLTYRELNRYADALAYFIKDSYKPLIVYGHMSPFMIVGMIASIKAGCGYVPLDISMPEDRIKSIIKKIEPEYIWNTTETQLDLNHAHILDTNIFNEVDIPNRFESQINGSDIAYTIFTSGSTGEPKGVQIRYDSLNEFTQWMIDLNKIGENQQWLNQAPFSFDLSVMAIYPCLATGGTLNLVDKTMISKPKLLNDMLLQAKINVWVSTPSFMEMCLMLPDLSEEHYESLKEFFFCGEILPHKTAKMLLQRFPSAYIYNTYGPTEATVAVTSILITEAVINQYNPLPVGKVRPGTQLTLAENEELVISGQCVSEGYVKDEQRSKAVFKDIKQRRAYYTGDKATVNDDLWFITGRIDFQVKLNGYRMELEEIEFHLRQIDVVKEAIVVPIYKSGKVTQLQGVVVLNQSNDDNERQTLIHDIKQELKQTMPEYMIPRKIIFRDQFPLTINGKLDRKQIAEDILT
ncbi:D-alanine--poly(phosphoribitol) ligase subunit DltA [Staphylococcus edaphicus]|uniref:D-alanine--D-alanyl carrier protein ligase n=1 Tax=Staphylococcus edaphicus TaxID=1955013 RepID=A0A2C6WM26_9STAP|nr:D-alanine--poly(phosphoribitol) ligase subunit DltA [Staphylococcus edaphicus]PHK48844.1 D-alanine--poly(phosphoribitol) ligase subunit 1 [Staphylococcus edaphicus]UQW80879.1 D-alanine--poly(phosphoribitol) ligase subunit DltA [Staphylococcus edaphicus]